MHSGIFRARQLGVLIFFITSLALLALRLLFLQVIQHRQYAHLANQQHTITVELPPRRGAIFDRNMRALALNLNCDSVFANPRLIADPNRTSAALAALLDLDQAFVKGRLSRNKGFVWIKRKVTESEALKVKEAKLAGVDIVRESKRFYPNKSMACHVLGAVNIDNIGLEGIELLYDRYLKGESGWLASSQDGRRKILEYYQDEFVPAKDGFDLVLTIDEVIQHIAERELKKICVKYHAKSASIIVIDPKNGDVLALANYPGFDLNVTSSRPIESIKNRAINDFFEPGSVFKVITASALLEERLVTLDERFDCENGAWAVGGRVLHDHTPHGIMSFREVIEKSSNIGTVKSASKLGTQRLYKYVKTFGFYDRTGVDLPWEVSGSNRAFEKWSSSSMLAIPMGHEVTATAMQLASAIAVIADNGYLVRPRIVKKIIDGRGQTIKDMPPRIVRKVISPETAYRMRKLLMGAVENGTGKKAKIEEYHTGGKTGTAQKVEPGGVYSHDRFVASFIGFAPVEKPVMAVAVCVDEPRPVYYGGEVAAPVFRNVVDESLKYLNARAYRSIR